MVVEINGHTHEVYFGLEALELFYSKVGILEKKDFMKIKNIRWLVYAGLQNAAECNGVALALSPATVYKWVEEQFLLPEGIQKMAEIMEEFTHSQVVKNVIDRGNEVAAETGVKKKKSTSTK